MKTQAVRPHRIGYVAIALVSALTLVWGASEAQAQQKKNGAIGFVIATTGSVTITSKVAGARPASLRLSVNPNDVIKTGPKSSTKILFDDNTILNVGEDTQFEITEYVYDPRRAKRSTIFKMAQGTLKAVVAAFYSSTNSRFEIRTPTAVAAARGTEYVVWTFVQAGQVFTGIAVTTGTVTLTNAAGQSVTVAAGQYSVTSATTAPSAPATTATAPPNVQNQISKGEVVTDPAVVAQVTVTMTQQEQAAQQAIGVAAETAKAEAAQPAQQTALPLVTPTDPTVTQVTCAIVSPSGEQVCTETTTP